VDAKIERAGVLCAFHHALAERPAADLGKQRQDIDPHARARWNVPRGAQVSALERTARKSYKRARSIKPTDFPVSKTSRKTYDDVRAAFESGRILKCPPAELDQLLVAADCEKIADTAEQARASAMRATLRHLLASKQNRQLQRNSSRWAMFASLLAAAALLFLVRQAFSDARGSRSSSAAFGKNSDRFTATIGTAETGGDPRTHFTLAELAKRAPSIRDGTLQAWWAGEQARQVQHYEAQAKRQALAGDSQGAARSAKRADEIRSGIHGLREPEITVNGQWRSVDDPKAKSSR
jgi:hypothetical protein